MPIMQTSLQQDLDTLYDRRSGCPQPNCAVCEDNRRIYVRLEAALNQSPKLGGSVNSFEREGRALAELLRLEFTVTANKAIVVAVNKQGEIFYGETPAQILRDVEWIKGESNATLRQDR